MYLRIILGINDMNRIKVIEIKYLYTDDVIILIPLILLEICLI